MTEEQVRAVALKRYTGFYHSIMRLEDDGGLVLPDDLLTTRTYAAISFGIKVEDIDNS